MKLIIAILLLLNFLALSSPPEAERIIEYILPKNSFWVESKESSTCIDGTGQTVVTRTVTRSTIEKENNL
jgi:hypothetical protein